MVHPYDPWQSHVLKLSEPNNKEIIQDSELEAADDNEHQYNDELEAQDDGEEGKATRPGGR